MVIYQYPDISTWKQLIQRPAFETAVMEEKIVRIFDAVIKKGDVALRQFTKEFDGVELVSLKVSENEFAIALNAIDPQLFDAIRLAAENITKFHRAQSEKTVKIETMPGVVCWRKSIAIEKVGLYIPGGTAPLFSTVLMLAIPALIAGCREIVICTPPGKEGRVHPAVLAAAKYIGINTIYKVGGAQAIAAMAFGTASVPGVSKIFGPGNQFVTMAKQLVQKQGIAIDMPAGPSEVAVFADHTANSAFVAADLLSQAEHGSDSQVIFVTDHEPLLNEVQDQVERQLKNLPRKEFAIKALENSKAVLFKNRQESMKFLNEYAPEHLILSCENAEALAEQVINAGSVFIGHYSPESAGDYATGTNHTLPTNGYAQAYAGVSVDSFVKKITFQQLTKEGLANVGNAVQVMAEAEGLHAHAEAVRIRLENQ
jgi:histidinol dehydrogenase